MSFSTEYEPNVYNIMIIHQLSILFSFSICI